MCIDLDIRSTQHVYSTSRARLKKNMKRIKLDVIIIWTIAQPNFSQPDFTSTQTFAARL